MRKVLTIAHREFSAMVVTKAFLLSLVLMPILMGGGIVAAALMGRMSEEKTKTLVIFDGTGGTAFTALERAAKAHNALNQPVTRQDGKGPPPSGITKFNLERGAEAALSDAERLKLSERSRRGEIDAFVELLADLYSTEPEARPVVRYHSQQTPLADSRQWLERTLSELVRAERLRALALDPELVRRATAPVALKSFNLAQASSNGEIKPARESNELRSIFVPFGMMMLMFMVIMMTAQPALETVLEEKSNRIAEVLLGSANPFQLMTGKLLGTVAGSVCILSVYLAGGLGLAWYKDWLEFVPWGLVPWFIAYQILAVLFFNSIFLAIGASVNQLKEAQSLLLPVWLLMALPMFVWFNLVREPNGKLATWLSFFPPSTPLVMTLRLGTQTAVPVWQPIAGFAVMLLATLVGVYLAGRIFRVGILWQGAAPKLRDLARWALSG